MTNMQKPVAVVLIVTSWVQQNKEVAITFAALGVAAAASTSGLLKLTSALGTLDESQLDIFEAAK